MIWTTHPDSATRARALLDDGRDLPTLYKLALYGLTRTGATDSHRVLAAGYLNLHDEVLDTQSVGSHS